MPAVSESIKYSRSHDLEEAGSNLSKRNLNMCAGPSSNTYAVMLSQHRILLPPSWWTAKLHAKGSPGACEIGYGKLLSLIIVLFAWLSAFL